MQLLAFASAQPASPAQPIDAAREVNSAGLATLLWVTVLAVVFFALLAAAGLSLLRSRRRMRD